MAYDIAIRTLIGIGIVTAIVRVIIILDMVLDEDHPKTLIVIGF